MERGKILMPVVRTIGIGIGGLLFWALLIFGVYRGVQYIRGQLNASTDDSSYQDDLDRPHDGLLRRSVGRDDTNWAPGGGR